MKLDTYTRGELDLLLVWIEDMQRENPLTDDVTERAVEKLRDHLARVWGESRAAGSAGKHGFWVDPPGSRLPADGWGPSIISSPEEQERQAELNRRARSMLPADEEETP